MVRGTRVVELDEAFADLTALEGVASEAGLPLAGAVVPPRALGLAVALRAFPSGGSSRFHLPAGDGGVVRGLLNEKLRAARVNPLVGLPEDGVEGLGLRALEMEPGENGGEAGDEPLLGVGEGEAAVELAGKVGPPVAHALEKGARLEYVHGHRDRDEVLGFKMSTNYEDAEFNHTGKGM